LVSLNRYLFAKEVTMNGIETGLADPVRKRFKRKLHRLAVSDNQEEIATLGRRLTRLVDEISFQYRPYPATGRLAALTPAQS